MDIRDSFERAYLQIIAQCGKQNPQLTKPLALHKTLKEYASGIQVRCSKEEVVAIS